MRPGSGAGAGAARGARVLPRRSDALSLRRPRARFELLRSLVRLGRQPVLSRSARRAMTRRSSCSRREGIEAHCADRGARFADLAARQFPGAIVSFWDIAERLCLCSGRDRRAPASSSTPSICTSVAWRARRSSSAIPASVPRPTPSGSASWRSTGPPTWCSPSPRTSRRSSASCFPARPSVSCRPCTTRSHGPSLRTAAAARCSWARTATRPTSTPCASSAMRCCRSFAASARTKRSRRRLRHARRARRLRA